MLNKLQNYFHNHSLRKTRDLFLAMSDAQLEDIGVSKDLLVKGIQHWPWGMNVQPTVQQPKLKAAEINRAISELSAMSDHELRDIGLSRGTIRHAVNYGANESAPYRAA